MQPLRIYYEDVKTIGSRFAYNRNSLRDPGNECVNALTSNLPHHIDTSDKQSLFKCCGTWMTTFSTNPYFIIFQRFECYTTLIVKELLYINKIKFFYFYFKKCRNLHNFDRNQCIK